jgi:uncharacterized protein (TIGR03083 family)
MNYQEHVAAAEVAAAALASALRDGSPDARVPTCPDWSLADLAEHVGNFSGLWAHVLCEGTGRPKTPFPDIPDGAARAGWFEDQAGHLMSELRATPPDTTVWTWDPENDKAIFAARRSTHELTVHRFDAQLGARGAADPIEPDVAADGIEEIFVMVRAWAGPGRGDGETLHLHSTEGHEWLIAMTPDGLEIERAHGKGDLALRGAVSDLELVLLQRPPLGQVERIGDESVLDVWHRVFTFG